MSIYLVRLALLVRLPWLFLFYFFILFLLGMCGEVLCVVILAKIQTRLCGVHRDSYYGGDVIKLSAALKRNELITLEYGDGGYAHIQSLPLSNRS